VRGGRTFIRNLIDLLPKVSNPYHYVRLSSGARSDIAWWIVGLTKFHGSTPFTVDLPEPSFYFSTDACLVGGAGFCNSDWFYVSWEHDFPNLCQSHINVLELKTILLAAKRWGASWSGRHILVRSDSMSAVAAINNTTSRSAELLKLVKELFWLTVEFNFKLSAKFLPGKDNIMSDRLSRLDDKSSAIEAHYLMYGLCFPVVFCNLHMSHESYLFLQASWGTTYWI
jgi:hypothetical protein